MANLIKQLKDRLGITNIFPITKVKAVYDDDGNRLDNIMVKKGSSNTDNVGWSSGNYPYMTVGGSRKRLELHTEYSQKYAWVNASVGAINNGDRLSVSFDDSAYECEKHVNLTSILPNGFNQNNCVILSANSTWAPSWGKSASTGTEMMIMNSGRVGLGVSKVTVTEYYVANVLVMRTDI